MPLDKSGSKASVGNNIKTEMAAGKPQKQAEAIALSEPRRNQQGGKPPKGKGMVTGPSGKKITVGS